MLDSEKTLKRWDKPLFRGGVRRSFTIDSRGLNSGF